MQNGRSMSFAPDDAPPWSPQPEEEDGSLGIVERRMLDRGKKEHKETTEAAKRALKIAEQTADIAGCTLVEVQRQGQALDKADLGLETMEKDVKEASNIMRFMRRWCCFQVLCCCDCFDPHADMDRTRTRRLRERSRHHADVKEAMELQKAAQLDDIGRAFKKSDPAYNGDNEAARKELMAGSHNNARSTVSAPESAIGYGLPPADAEEIQEESAKQDEYLDRIGGTVDTLKFMSLELQRELGEQEPQIDALSDRTQGAHLTLGTLARAARRI